MSKSQASSRVLRMRDLPAKVGYQPPTIYHLIAEGKFPAPHKLRPGGRAAGWREETIDAWLEAKDAKNKNAQKEANDE